MSDGALATIRDLEDGRLLEMLAEALQLTSDEVTEIGTTGSVTLKLEVKARREHGDTTISVMPFITRAAPKRNLRGVIRFNRDGRISRSDTRQTEMPLRAVEIEPATVREFNADTSVREA